MAAAEVLAILRANTSEFTAKMDEAERKVASVSKAGGSNFEKLGQVGKMALLGVAGAAVAGGAAAVDLADKYDAARAQLKSAAEGSGASFKAVQEQASAADGTMSHYGYTAAQVEAATATLTIAQGSHVKVQKDLSLAANIAAARNIDLSSAINLVNKAAEGNTGALKRMGIDLPIAAGGALKVKTASDALSAAQQKVNADLTAGAGSAAVGSKAYITYQADLGKVQTAHQNLTDAQQAGTRVIDALSQRFGGQASAAAETMDGKLKSMKAQAENLGANIGQKLIPVLEKLVTGISTVVNWLEKHSGVAKALGIALAGLAVGFIAVSVAGAIMEATFSPVIAIIVGVVAAVTLLSIGAYELATHWKQVWTDIKNWFGDALAFLRSGFGEILLLVMGPIGWIILLATHWKEVWGVIKTAVSDAWEYIGPIFNFIYNAIKTYIMVQITAMRDIWNAVWPVVSQAVQTTWSILQPIFNFIYNAIKTYVMDEIIAMRDVWNAVWAVVAMAVQIAWNDVIKPAWDALKLGISNLKDVANDIGSVFSSVWNAIGSAIKTAWDDVIKPVFDAISSAWNGIKDVVNWFTGSGSSAKAPASASHPTPGKATGGPIVAGQATLVGENGPELFTPSSSGSILGNSALFNALSGNSGISPIGGGAGSPGTGQPVYLQINGQTFATLMLPFVQTAALQTQRGLSVPLFGTPQ